MIAFCALTGARCRWTSPGVLGELWGEEEKIITIEQIQRKVCETYGLKLSDIKAKNRTKAVAFPRQIAMYLARQLTTPRCPRWPRLRGKDTRRPACGGQDRGPAAGRPKLRKTSTDLSRHHAVIHRAPGLSTALSLRPSRKTSGHRRLPRIRPPHRLILLRLRSCSVLFLNKTLESLMDVFLTAMRSSRPADGPEHRRAPPDAPDLANVLLETDGEACA